MCCQSRGKKDGVGTDAKEVKYDKKNTNAICRMNSLRFQYPTEICTEINESSWSANSKKGCGGTSYADKNKHASHVQRTPRTKNKQATQKKHTHTPRI